MAGPRNAGREIAWSLSAAVLFGVGFAAYLLHSMPTPKQDLLVPSARGTSEQAGGRTPLAPELVAATSVVENFARALAQKNYAAAYDLMAKQYRDAVTLDEFQQVCVSSDWLSNVQRGVLRSTRRMAVSEGPYTEQGPGALVTSAGSIDTTFTFLVNGSDVRLLVVSLVGVPVFDGIGAAIEAGKRKHRVTGSSRPGAD
jgi:hypothetical protein